MIASKIVELIHSPLLQIFLPVLFVIHTSILETFLYLCTPDVVCICYFLFFSVICYGVFFVLIKLRLNHHHFLVGIAALTTCFGLNPDLLHTNITHAKYKHVFDKALLRYTCVTGISLKVDWKCPSSEQPLGNLITNLSVVVTPSSILTSTL